MRVLEVLNSYPGETFIRQHADALLKHTDIRLSWAFWQVSNPGAVSRKPVKGLENCMNLANVNRMSKLSKIMIRSRHLGRGYSSILSRQIKKMNPDLLHFQFASLAVKHFRTAANLQLPFTFSVRGADIQTVPLSVAHYADGLKHAIRSAAAIHCVSGSIRNLLLHYAADRTEAEGKTSIIRTAIDPTWSTIVRQPVKGRFLAVGRLNWQKGYPDLILACKVLKEQGYPFTLKIVGDGEQREQLQYMIRDLMLNDAVFLVGKRSHDEIRHYFAEAELFVLSSLAEGFPNVVGEAMLAGVPFIATDVGGLREVLPEQFADCIVPAGDHKLLAEKIVMRRDEKSDSLVEEARQIAGHVFSPLQHATDFRQFWHNALANTR